MNTSWVWLKMILDNKIVGIPDDQRARMVARYGEHNVREFVIGAIEVVLDAIEAGVRLRRELETDPDAIKRAIQVGDYYALLGCELIEAAASEEVRDMNAEN